MLMKHKYLKFCRYYKGEETIPWDKDFSKFVRFWIMERNYYTNTYEESHEYWENAGQNLLDDITFQKFLSKIDNITIRGFVAWAAVTSYDHNPAGGYLFMLKYKYNG